MDLARVHGLETGGYSEDNAIGHAVDRKSGFWAGKKQTLI